MDHSRRRIKQIQDMVDKRKRQIKAATTEEKREQRTAQLEAIYVRWPLFRPAPVALTWTQQIRRWFSWQ